MGEVLGERIRTVHSYELPLNPFTPSVAYWQQIGATDSPPDKCILDNVGGFSYVVRFVSEFGTINTKTSCIVYIYTYTIPKYTIHTR